MEIEQIKKEVDELIKKMNVKAEATVTIEDERYVIQFTTDTDAPFLIGRYGDMISSFQRYFEAMIFNLTNKQANVLVNVNDYRERQKERLEKIAENVAGRVMEQKREAYLRSFSPYERKIIHEYISTHYPDLSSHSVDEGSDRKLVVSLKGENVEPEKVNKEEDTIADLL